MKNFFDGYYYKHQKGEHVLSIIVGKSSDEEFIQVITNDFSCNIPFIGDNYFSSDGIKLNIQTTDITLIGEILYKNITPIKYDIMGPFKFFPMECRHGIISMHHELSGKITLNGQEIDFTGGTGYIEKDSGTSFPSSYTWLQANDFDDKCSIMVSVANIPFMGFSFKGCICVVYFNEKEYRLATYLGVKIIECNKNIIEIKQGKYRLKIEIPDNLGHDLNAPTLGKMSRIIKETISCKAKYSFYIKDKLLFEKESERTSFEYEA